MGIILFEHNQKAYDAAITMMEDEGKAAVIHPTGTGKSFIAFKLAQDHPEAKVCWLAPSEYIYHTQLENLRKVMPEEDLTFPNIQFLSYSRLLRNEEHMGELCPDYIVLDEFHRCGAAEWGKSVRKLLGLYPQARILGLSATNIRYLDGQRDMAMEIFQGNIASEMTLGEAIVRGILAAPKYVAAFYSLGSGHMGSGKLSKNSKKYAGYEDEIKELEQQIELLPNKEAVETNRKLLEQLRRALEQADGLRQVFGRHVQKKDGKYIIFCAGREHMEEAKENAGEWFGLVDKNPHIYTAYYNSPETNREFAAFKEDKSSHLKLLFCIDMLNEGVHVEDVDGVILLRPTVSPTIYLQQIGRSLSAGGSGEPVIFDLVNNFEGLCCIDCLEREMEEVLQQMIYEEECGGAGPSKLYGNFRGRFRIIDEVRDCRVLFRKLQNNLSPSWDVYYLAAQRYYRENGSLRISRGYVTPEGLSLGNWLKTQRKVYAGKVPGNLTEEKVRKLEAIGMVWNPKESNWEKGYRELESYYNKYGNVDVKARYVSESGFALGKWVSNLRTAVKKKGVRQALGEERQRQLEALGMVWDKKSEKWEIYLQAAREYYRIHGNLRVPVKYVTEDGTPLGNWLHGIRRRMPGSPGSKTYGETLTEGQIEQLNQVGMEWEKEGTVLWNLKFDLAKKYYEQNGNLDIPVSYRVEGVNLGRWISNVRAKRKNPRSSGMVLDEERIRQLDSIGMEWK